MKSLHRLKPNSFLLLFVVVTLTICNACSTAPGTAEPTVAPSPTPAVQIATPATSPTTAPVATWPGTPAAQATPVTTPGSEWKAYNAHGAQFAAPPAWTEQEPGVLEGPDGFAHLTSLPMDGAGPGAACISEANRTKPGHFGQLPEIRDIYQNGIQTGCLILPSPDQPAARRGESLLLLWLPSARQPAAHLALRADRTHIEAIAASLRMPEIAAPAPSNCDFTVQSQSARAYRAGGLTITEFPVARAAGKSVFCDPLADPPAFNAVATTGEAAERTARIVNEQFSGRRLAQLNQRLAPFGIDIRTIERRFVIEQNGEKLHANLSWIGPLSVNTSGSDFRLPVVDGYDGGTFILSPAGLQRQEGWDILLYDRVFPVFVGDDLLSLAYDYQVYPRQVNNPALLNILKNGQVIDTLSVSGSTLDGGPVRSLSSWQDRWLLELPGLVLENGQSLNERLGYSEMFTWRLVNERPFTFYRQAGSLHLSYDGQPLEPTYDEVLHSPLGGSAILLRLKAFESGLFFYARRSDIWYYVTVES